MRAHCCSSNSRIGATMLMDTERHLKVALAVVSPVLLSGSPAYMARRCGIQPFEVSRYR